MDNLQATWKRVPRRIRQVVIFILGLIFVIAAILSSPIPGPGGIPLFLIGIAILATEFEWAERLRDRILKLLKRVGQWLRGHVAYTTNIIVLLGTSLALGLILFFSSR